MYFVKYGDEYLHDPRINELTLLDLSLDGDENSCGFCDFTIYPNHPLYDKLQALDSNNPIRVYDGAYLLFSGYIYELGKEFYLDGHVKCKGDLAYLGASIVRPYSTAPKDVYEYFKWLIDNHNSQVDSGRKFKLGTIQNKSKVLDIINKDYTNTFDEIHSKLINDSDIGGYLSVSYDENERLINYNFDHSNNNTQVIDFGVNLTSYTLTDDFEDIVTYVIPTGAILTENDTVLTLSSLPDTTVESDFVKKGDILYSKTAVDKYGWIGSHYSNSEIESANDLLNEAVSVLKDAINPKRTIEIKAVDMHLLNPELKPIRVGEYVKVRSEPHGIDDYYLCNSISLDLNNPENSEYVFGKTPSTFTSSYKRTIKDEVTNAVNQVTEEQNQNGQDEQDKQEVLQINVNAENNQVNEVTFVYENGRTSYSCSYNENGLLNRFGNLDIVWSE